MIGKNITHLAKKKTPAAIIALKKTKRNTQVLRCYNLSENVVSHL